MNNYKRRTSKVTEDPNKPYTLAESKIISLLEEQNKLFIQEQLNKIISSKLEREVVVLLKKQNSILNMVVDELEKIQKELLWIRREL